MTQLVAVSRTRVLVTLTKDEMLHAAMIGCTRQIDNLYRYLRQGYAAPESKGFDMNVLGALGEKAVAKHFGVYWSGALGDYRAKDVGGAQVRTTDHPDGCLIVHEPPNGSGKGDSPSDPFILVTVHQEDGPPTFWLRGWCMGRDAQRIEYYRTSGVRHPAYFVPPEDLRSMSELRLPWSA